MGAEADREGVRGAVRRLLAEDRRRGALEDVAHYKNLFPGFWDVVGEEFDAVPSPDGGTGAATTIPGPGRAGEEASPGNVQGQVGPYRIVREIGRGGMGVVYEALDTRLSRRVALKVLGPAFASSTHLRLRFRREAELAGKLDHPNVCTVYEAGEENGTPYLAMRFVEGRTVAEFLELSRDHIRPSGVAVLPPMVGAAGPPADASKEKLDTILVVFEKTALGLHHAHEKGLIHRDIKPHNIMVTPDGEPVLLDFGLARDETGEGHRLTQTGSLMGTPAYMSPEQLRTHELALDRRTDVYSLGVSLYECLTLKLPFEAPTVDGLYRRILSTDPQALRRRNPALPRDLEVVTAKAMERDRDRRYGSAREFAEDLRRVRTFEPIRARPAGRGLRLRRWVQRNPALAATTIVAGIALSVGAAASLHLQETAHDALGRADAETVQRRRAEQEARASAASVAAARHERDRAKRVQRMLSGASPIRARAIGLSVASREAGARSRGGTLDRRDPMLALLLARAGQRVDPCSETLTSLNLALQEFQDGAGPAAGPRTLPAAGEVALGAIAGNTLPVLDRFGRERAVLRGHMDRIESAVLSPSGDRVLTASSDGTARLWSPDGAELAVLPGHGKPLFSGTFVPTGDRVLTMSRDGTARLWDSRGTATAVMQGPETVFAPRPYFSPAGDRLLIVFNGYRPGGIVPAEARLWDLDGNEIAAIRAAVPDALPVRFSPSGSRLLTQTDHAEGVLQLRDRDGKEIAAFRVQGLMALAAVFSPGGDRLLVAEKDGPARLHDVDGSELVAYRGHDIRILSVSFSPSGERVGIRYRDGVVRVCDLAGGERLFIEWIWNESIHEREESVLFLGTGDVLRTLTEKGRERLWLLDPAEALRRADALATRDFTPKERETYGDLLGDAAGPGK